MSVRPSFTKRPLLSLALAGALILMLDLSQSQASGGDDDDGPGGADISGDCLPPLAREDHGPVEICAESDAWGGIRLQVRARSLTDRPESLAVKPPLPSEDGTAYLNRMLDDTVGPEANIRRLLHDRPLLDQGWFPSAPIRLPQIPGACIQTLGIEVQRRVCGGGLGPLQIRRVLRPEVAARVGVEDWAALRIEAALIRSELPGEPDQPVDPGDPEDPLPPPPINWVLELLTAPINP
ncbi:MAG: hypothetical protein IT285_04895 [Bdellovibrionales bacterium]|nr:hypothetical protein [Bdellovibrionales bacterium]